METVKPPPVAVLIRHTYQMRAKARHWEMRFSRYLLDTTKCGGFGYTQRQLAIALGVTQATVSRWCAGKIPMPLWAMLALCTLQGPLADPAKTLADVLRNLSFETMDIRKQIDPILRRMGNNFTDSPEGK